MVIPPNCSVCLSDISPDDVDLAAMAAVCRSCNHLVDLQHELRGTQPLHGTTPEREMAAEVPPAGIQVATEPGRLVLRRRWYHRSVWAIAAFCIFWNGILVFWYLAVFAALAAGEWGAIWLGALFPIGHVTIGVYLAWSVVANFLNTTTITVHRGLLTVTHGPVWWRAPTPTKIQELDQFFVTKPERAKTPRSQHWRYELHGVQRDRTAQRLLTALPDLETARYIERRLESYLELVDRRIQDEIPR